MAAPRPLVLVTGASGYVGRFLVDALATVARVRAMVATDESFAEHFAHACTVVKVDLRDAAAVDAAVTDDVDVVVHLAAMSSPAACARDPDAAAKINVPDHLFRAVARAGARLITLSTDQVYDGARAPYTEDDEAAPVNEYGRSKLRMEHAAGPQAVILRMSLVLGPPARGACKKQSFVQFCAQSLVRGESFDAFTNEYRSAVFINDVVRCITVIALDQGFPAGVYNLGGPERVSRWDMAVAVADVLGPGARDLVRAATRLAKAGDVASPPDIAMDTTKLRQALQMATAPEFATAEFAGLRSMVRHSV